MGEYGPNAREKKCSSALKMLSFLILNHASVIKVIQKIGFHWLLHSKRLIVYI